MRQKELHSLIEKAKRQDSESFTELMEFYMKDMYRVALAILMNDEDVADAIQDTILTCWEKMHSLREVAYFKTWLIRILMNKCYDIRKEAVATLPFEEAAYNEPSAENCDNLELKEALSTLNEKYRSIMMLFYAEGYRVGEIASLLGLPQSTVRTRLQRGREKLAAYYGVSERKERNEERSDWHF